MTDAHVVADCDTLDVGGEPMRVIGTSDLFDLAILTPIAPRSTDYFLIVCRQARMT